MRKETKRRAKKARVFSSTGTKASRKPPRSTPPPRCVSRVYTAGSPAPPALRGTPAGSGGRSPAEPSLPRVQPRNPTGFFLKGTTAVAASAGSGLRRQRASPPEGCSAPAGFPPRSAIRGGKVSSGISRAAAFCPPTGGRAGKRAAPPLPSPHGDAGRGVVSRGPAASPRPL